ncbi:MAG TPA: tetraacyldisaccharide 4'-kinase [Pyrinomonadaceae bacterium]|nr:tetraacyldisaccharide 4'-kinase [Pyrinomonadaceae bacterium]
MLRPLGWLYGRITNLRNSLYDRGVFKSHSLGARTISVGNITTGGTGKTPLVAYVAELLAANGERVCILTRGYGRKSTGRVLVSDGETVLVDAIEGGDEPVELGRRLIGKATVVADADRVSAAKWAKAKFDVTTFVLDDGFQHRRAERDLDIVCIDATKPFGFLREPLHNLSRADAIVLTRADLIDTHHLLEQIRTQSPDAPAFQAEYRLRSLASINPIADAFAFCGIGNPKAFLIMLEREGLNSKNSVAFRDHHDYTQDDIDRVESKARESGCRALITTQKDFVKVEDLKFSLPCMVAKIDVVISDPDAFRDLVLSA